MSRHSFRRGQKLCGWKSSSTTQDEYHHTPPTLHTAMAKKLPAPPPPMSFFKIMTGDFKNSIRIPRAFAKHARKNLVDKCILRCSDNRAWPVDIRVSDNDLFFCGGWDFFVEQHSITSGSFLLFSYDGVTGFKVTVFLENGCEKFFAGIGQKTPEDAVTTDQTTENTTAARKHPHQEEGINGIGCEFFKGAYRQSNMRPVIPRYLVDKYKLKDKNFITMKDSIGRTQRVELKLNKDGRMRFGGAWLRYLRSDLSEGDICDFEFVKAGNEVLVHRQSRAVYDVSAKAREMNSQVAASFIPANPNFVLSWRVIHTYRVRIPNSVLKELRLKNRTMFLEDPQGRSWQVQVVVRLNGHTDIGQGWNNFVKANYLQEGDACVLEFLPTDRIVVHIYRIADIMKTIE